MLSVGVHVRYVPLADIGKWRVIQARGSRNDPAPREKTAEPDPLLNRRRHSRRYKKSSRTAANTDRSAPVLAFSSPSTGQALAVSRCADARRPVLS